jgi:hypothetical protein
MEDQTVGILETQEPIASYESDLIVIEKEIKDMERLYVLCFVHLSFIYRTLGFLLGENKCPLLLLLFCLSCAVSLVHISYQCSNFLF